MNVSERLPAVITADTGREPDVRSRAREADRTTLPPRFRRSFAKEPQVLEVSGESGDSCGFLGVHWDSWGLINIIIAGSMD